MTFRNTISISQARKEIFDIARQVQQPGQHFVLTDKGRPKIVMLSAEEFESLIETIEVLRMCPNLDDDIKKVEDQYRKGQYITLDELLAKEGYKRAGTTKKNVISRRRSGKSSARPR